MLRTLQPLQMILLFLSLTLLVRDTHGGSHASIKSIYGQLVTSSTLRWKSLSNDKIPPEAVYAGTGDKKTVICRSEHHGSLLVGQTVPVLGGCGVGFINKTYRKKKYELLINIDMAARLEWRAYNRYSGVPEGSVAGLDASTGSNQIFIGRHLTTEGLYLPGVVDIPQGSYEFGILRVWDVKGGVHEFNSGDVLVEIEPESYELELELTDRKPRKSSRDVALVQSSLFRFDEGREGNKEARLQKVLSYEYEKSEYYGQIPGMIRALPTNVRLPKGQIQSVLWGLPEKSIQQETLMVGHELEPYSAVDVAVVGVRMTEEEPYVATLTSVFSDGSRMTRRVDGILQRRYLDNIRPEYSRIYQIKDSSKVDSEGEFASPSASKDTSSPLIGNEIMLSDQEDTHSAASSASSSVSILDNTLPTNSGHSSASSPIQGGALYYLPITLLSGHLILLHTLSSIQIYI
ncbi:protein unzipped [Lepeophtheirus salmonis]|uniref:protein unzipped n=1 Tax=Lepeophtheirus salmonis TaxID=72036 RepID=UPI001AE37912|nr:uncharacterized protein LOC121122282 [Lepeophtheirus salmonis]XP_040573212.1 uncharacterized protein LOC121122282 [Lepeophtheirus salmonis]XP_040573220.1 uncharacterized protein LOC121122282 [Lepeophtheirus salmonis]XP_040573224.1 uncharacterized protein LOC121122282 [Lepeophtheirus salmonis]